MPTRRRRVALVSLLAAALTVTALSAGCSSKKETPAAPLPDPATLISQSAQTTKTLQSTHLQLTVTGTIKDLPITSLTGDLTNTPAVAAQGTADISFLGQKLSNVGVVVVDGTLYASITPNSWQNFGPAADIYDVSTILNPNTGVANLLTTFTEPKAVGQESVAGAETEKITGVVPADAVNKLAPQIAATGPVPATVWIATAGDHQLMQAKLDPTPGNSVQLTLSDWGKTVTVTKPAV